MRARIGFARKSNAMHKLPLFSLLSSSKNGTIPKVYLMNTGECHRPWGMVTGQIEVVIDYLWSYRPSIIGRSALDVIDRPKLPAEPVLIAAEGKTRHGDEFSSKCVHQYTPYHVYDSKGDRSRFSDHQSRISMRNGPRKQVVYFYVKWNANQIST